MSVYAYLPMIDTMTALVEFVGTAPPGAAAEYDFENTEIKAQAWKFACKGKVTLFKRRRPAAPDAPLQRIIVRLSTEAANKLGQPDYQTEFTIQRNV